MSLSVLQRLKAVSPRRPLSIFILGLVLSAMALTLMPVATPEAMAAAPVSSVVLRLTVMKEQRIAASDGTTKINLVDVAKVTPGDRLVYVLTYKNTGAKPVSDLVLNYPLPQGITYRSAAEGSPAPQLSTDGVHFTPTASDAAIKTLRWQVAGDLAPGASGKVSFKAVLN